MKIRRDFVSNSSSTSYILYIDDQLNINRYFREISRYLDDNLYKCKNIKDKKNCQKFFDDSLFKYVIIDTHKENISKTLKKKLDSKCKAIIGQSDTEAIEEYIKIDSNCCYYMFPEFYGFYLNCGEKIQKKLKNSIVNFVYIETESIYDDLEPSDNWKSIFKFCFDFDIEIKSENMWV